MCTHSSKHRTTCKCVRVTSSCCKLTSWVRRHRKIPLPPSAC
jgi:hypothetical protein